MIWSDEENSEEEKEKVEIKEQKSESDEEEESSKNTTRILTQKEKIIDSIRSIYNSIHSGIKNQTYKTISEKFEDFSKNIDRVLNNFKAEEIPAYFYESLAIVEDLTSMSKEDIKKLSGENNNHLNNIKKLELKVLKKIGNGYKEYKNNRIKEEKELEEDLNKIEEYKKKKQEDAESKNIKKKTKKKKYEFDDEFDIIELYFKDKAANKPPSERRKKWEKKVEAIKPEPEKEPEKKDEDEKEKQKEKEKIKKNVTVEKQQEIITDADIKKELDQMSNQRGQNKYSLDNVERLEFLFSKTENKLIQLEIITESTLQCFDNYANQLIAFPSDLWNKIYKDIERMMELHDLINKEKNDTNKNDIEQMNLSLQNDLSVRMEKLENELYKSLQYNTNSNTEYSNCVLNEIKFLTLCKKVELFYKNYNNIFCIAKIYLLVIMHTYYKTANQVKNLIKKYNLQLKEDDYIQKIIINNDKDFFQNLCNQVYQTLDEESKVKVMLYQIYFLCVKNEYELATKLFNSSNIYELISLFKTETLKVLFNRTLAQLGLCAFKNLDLEQVLKYLTPLCNKGPTKLKEYLSQSYNKDSEKNALFDRGDKMRTIPTIMRINANDLDTIFYLSSMIYDVPQILFEKIFGRENDDSNNSHPFERLFYNFQRQQFNGPSNIDKDKILATTTLLMKGDWKKCVEVIKDLNIIKKYNTLQDKLFELIKRTALKCFIIFYMSEYDSFEFNNLCQRFQIKDYEVKNIINDMILTGKIKAKWNDNFLLMKSNDRDSVLNMKKLIENIQTITRQNLELMQTAMALANND